MIKNIKALWLGCSPVQVFSTAGSGAGDKKIAMPAIKQIEEEKPTVFVFENISVHKNASITVD